MIIYSILIISFTSNAQVNTLTNTTWGLTNLNVNGINSVPTINDEVESVLLTMLEDSDPFTEDFLTNVCNTLTSSDGIVVYDESTSICILPELVQSLITCTEPGNSTFESDYFIERVSNGQRSVKKFMKK